MTAVQVLNIEVLNKGLYNTYMLNESIKHMNSTKLTELLDLFPFALVGESKADRDAHAKTTIGNSTFKAFNESFYKDK